MRVKLFIICVVVFMVSAVLLITGSPALTYAIADEFPAGTLIVWAGFLAFPLMLYFGFFFRRGLTGKGFAIFRNILLILVALAAGWGFVSYLLAGNWAYNFSGQIQEFRGSAKAGVVFRYYSGALVMLPILYLSAFSIWLIKAKPFNK